MKSKLLTALALACLCPLLSATTTVAGSIKTLGTTVAKGSYVRFWLRGCKGNQPRVSGVAIFPANVNGQFYFDVPTDAAGTVAGTIYSTRDANGIDAGEIECGGSRVATWYGMQVFRNSVGGPEVPVHAKNTGTLDVSNVTPISTQSVVVAPTGDQTYLRVDGGNSPVTGPVTFNGGDTFNGNVDINGNGTFSGILQAPYLIAGGYAVPVEKFGAVGDWNGSSGTDDTAAIQACLNSLTSGNCLLQAKRYKTSAPLTINRSGVGLVGVDSFQPNSGVFTSNPSLSTIVSTSASADILDISGVSTSNSIYGNSVKNLTLARSVVPSGSAKGLSLSYSYRAQISNVVSIDSIYNFYFRGVGSMGFGYIENNIATWGYNGVTETSGNLYGFYVDTSGGVFSPSIRIRHNHVASNLGAGVTTYGYATVGTLGADWHLLHDETANLNYGIYINNSGSGYTASSDLELVNPIMDGCKTACIYVTGLSGSVNITGGWLAAIGANAVAADFESGAAGSQVSMVNTTAYASGVTGSAGVIIGRSSYNLQLIGSKIQTATSSSPAIYFNGVTAGVISGNTIWSAAGTTTLVSLVGSINVAISSNVLNGASTNGILLDSNTHGISGLETNTCGASIATITNCEVDNGGNPAGFISGTYIVPVAYSSLPTCSAGLEGVSRAVNNSSTATFNGAISGAGSNHVIAYCNGTAWVAH